MWVLGTQYNQIAGFKIDDYTGNLTQILNSPYHLRRHQSGVDRREERWTLRLRRQSRALLHVGTTPAVAGNIAAFSVGNDGVLTFQQSYASQGSTPVWATSDSAGSFLYVLDPGRAPMDPGNGSITVFAIDATTGRLQLVPNQQIKNAQRHRS